MSQFLMLCYKTISKKLYLLRVDRLVNKHFRHQKRLNLHTLFLCFGNSKNICNPSPSTSNVTKKMLNLIRNCKRNEVFGVKGCKYSMISELK